eukprot:1193825-Prorocentrum_minimum.AAC.2
MRYCTVSSNAGTPAACGQPETNIYKKNGVAPGGVRRGSAGSCWRRQPDSARWRVAAGDPRPAPRGGSQTAGGSARPPGPQHHPVQTCGPAVHRLNRGDALGPQP